MIVVLVLMALMQDGAVQTAPPASTVDFSAYAEVVRTREAQAQADPGPVCTFGGRPVSSPGCPPPSGRLTWDVDLVRPEPGTSQAPSEEACADPANRPSGRAGFDCALAESRRAGGRAGSPGFRAAPDGSDVPGWALDDPKAWEDSQCGAAGDDACRRQARNRFAIARAGLAVEPPAAAGSAAPDNCRMVMRRSQDGFGGSLSRVCGDAAEVEASLDRLEGALRPALEPCDRPASLETQEAWIARCRPLPLR